VEFLLDRPPFFVGGIAIGLVVVLMLATINQRLGVSGGFSEVVERIGRRSFRFTWRSWFLFGIVGGGALFVLLAGGQAVGDGYGWLTRAFGSELAVGAVLVGGGALIGYGSKLAGGCTSGHGISGNAFASPASVVSTTTFMATAIATAFVTDWLW
jgi:uncharacterized membrane protein YedE/YeeE